MVKTYVALLRGINIGGRSKVSMSDLRQLFGDLGHANAKTYIQSGNVVFDASGRSPAKTASEIAARIEKDLGVSCAVVVRAGDELATVLNGNPYLTDRVDASKLYVTFLEDAPDREAAARLVAPTGENTEFTLAGREVYLHCPNGYGRTKLNNTYIEKRLGVVATTRNWNTVTKLHQLATETDRP